MFKAASPETILSERYEITEVMEQGKYGAAIFAAYGYERKTEMPVFMKAKEHDESGRTSLRMSNEVNHLGSLYHPQITRVIEADPCGYHPYMVTLRMPGSLEPYEWLKDNANAPLAAKICLSALKALQYVHEQRIVHRDIKAHNMTIEWTARTALNDFELALNDKQRSLRETSTTGKKSESAGITSPGKMVGTPTHVAPEQLHGQDATELSDIYAMGVTLYGLAYGHLPFEGKTDDVLRYRLHKDIDYWPEGRQPPAALRSVIEKATSEHPEDRHQSAGEMAEDLERYLYR